MMMSSNRRSTATRPSRRETEQQEQERRKRSIRILGKETTPDPELTAVSRAHISVGRKKKNKKPSPVQDENLSLPQPISKRLKTLQTHSGESAGNLSQAKVDAHNPPTSLLVSVHGEEVAPATGALKKKKKKKKKAPKKITKTNNPISEVETELSSLVNEPTKGDQHYIPSELAESILDEMEEQTEEPVHISSALAASLLKYSSIKPAPQLNLPPSVHNYAHTIMPMKTISFASSPFGAIAFDEDSFEVEEEKSERSRSPTPETDEQSSVREDGQLYTCPICQEPDLSEIKLTAHVFKNHPKDKHTKSMVCPICSTKAGGDPNFLSKDFYGHLRLRHIGQPAEPQRIARPNLIFRPADIITRTPKSIFLGSMGVSRAVDRGRDVSDVLWEYVLALDVTSSSPSPLEEIHVLSPPCDACLGRIDSNTHTRAVLGCGHSFHSECVANEASPNCPVCTKKEKKKKPKSKGKSKAKKKAKAMSVLQL